ncbi:integral membrane sensor signal transduction histidine kinase [Caldicellulosiruptor saccharolyticus DSM 8903]|uniref:histidine kinase n=1 Tax=Caldicellulosiruptor saccharolyticus (strain ATCC 43494 / DSM 8903 / Tp8T 6331) TaxID=351627 RepID=A4XL33_CALS8|nr:ATP-binding protein [Caldicellulosiruptor saccharolyticus]ABP67618.1 integral membrane sensor signal transduction histidine kinase [Caldicellulosiruptor saccharolyticus DSM 8903]
MRTKIFGYTILVIIIISFLQGIFSYEVYKNIYLEENRKQLEVMVSEVERYINNFDIKLLYKVYKKSYFRVTIVDNKGVVLYDSEADKNKMENHLKRPEIVEANKYPGKICFSMRKSKTLNNFFLYAAKKVEIGNKPLFIRVSVLLDKIDVILKKALIQTLKFGLICIVFGMVLAIGISSLLYQPLKGLISLITDGLKKFDIVALKEEEDLKWLSLSFTKLYHLLEEKINEVNILNYRLSALLNSIELGIIFFDNKKRILMFNQQAEEIFATKLKNGTSLLECIRIYELFEFLYDENVFEKEFEITINGQNKILKVTKKRVKYDEDKEGMLLVVSDITFIKKLEKIRSDFVANVSHELKTPLTSIKGFVETLKDGAIEDKEIAGKFLNIIEVEVERLVRLINDLLYLSEIENAKIQVTEDDVNVKEVLEECIELLRFKAESKNIKMQLRLDDKLKMKIHKDWLKQIFINLIDNAIVYNRENGEVIIEVERLDEKIAIRVKDTGIGIPQNEIERIFERFYRVDKGRSRKLGGTGLGLSIVKHIVELYNGKIYVQSEVGKGSEFTIVI